MRRTASEQYEYELAATYRDQLRAVEVAREGQRVVSVSDRDQDVLGLYRQGDLVELAVLYVRSGRVVEAASLSQGRVEVPDDEHLRLRQPHEPDGRRGRDRERALGPDDELGEVERVHAVEPVAWTIAP